MIFYNLLSYF